MKIYGVVVVLILAGVVLGLGTIGGPSNALDVTLIERLAEVRLGAPVLTDFAIFLTQVGSVYGTLGAVLASAAWMWRAGRRHSATLLLGAAAAERLCLDLAKLAYDRPRPAIDLHPVVTHSSSFPSGHAGNSMTALVLIAVLAFPRAMRGRALAVAIPLAMLIGITRPYLGVHWPSDVLGGWAFAVIAILVAVAIARRPSIAAEQQHQIVGGHRTPLDQR